MRVSVLCLINYLLTRICGSEGAWCRALVGCVALLPAACGLIYAQEHKLSFEELGADQGLAKSRVYSIQQDRDGFLWLGTSNGVYKYDGYNCTLYQRTPAGEKLLPSDNVKVVYEDHTGQMWVGTPAGLAKFDRNTGTFQD